MGTKAAALGAADGPARFTFWAVAVSTLAAAALIMSVVALTVAVRDRAVSDVDEVAGIEVHVWDADKLEALEARMLAMGARIGEHAQTWDDDKLEAMEARMVAESARIEG
jgi:hypothetical protein